MYLCLTNNLGRNETKKEIQGLNEPKKNTETTLKNQLKNVIILSALQNTKYWDLHSVIAGFCCNVHEICPLLWYYAALCDKCVPTFWDDISAHLQGSRSPRRKKKYCPHLFGYEQWINTFPFHSILIKQPNILYLYSRLYFVASITNEFDTRITNTQFPCLQISPT
jgi:hypothetical protein